jgi:hypothetical protein
VPHWPVSALFSSTLLLWTSRRGWPSGRPESGICDMFALLPRAVVGAVLSGSRMPGLSRRAKRPAVVEASHLTSTRATCLRQIWHGRCAVIRCSRCAFGAITPDNPAGCTASAHVGAVVLSSGIRLTTVRVGRSVLSTTAALPQLHDWACPLCGWVTRTSRESGFGSARGPRSHRSAKAGWQ